MKQFCETNKIRRARPLLGTIVEVSMQGSESQKIYDAIDEAFKEMSLVHRLMSFHDSESDVSKLNQFASRTPTKVHPWTYEVLKKSVEIACLTKGLFDCTVASKLVEWEYLPRLKQETKLMQGTYADIEFLGNNKIYFRKPLIIDFGGIAKGFAVDKAVSALQEIGISAGSVNAGGDLRIFGEDEQPLYVRAPNQPTEPVFIKYAKEISVATSADYYSRKYLNGREVNPIINPINQEPCLRRWSVSVLASSCMIADALTKVVMLKGDDANPFLKEYDAEAFILKN